MDSERIKLIIKNMELLIKALKEEISEPPKLKYEEVATYLDNYEPDYYEEDD